MPNKAEPQTVKNSNVVSCRPAKWVGLSLDAEAQQRGVTRSRMAAIALEERYRRPIPPDDVAQTSTPTEDEPSA